MASASRSRPSTRDIVKSVADKVVRATKSARGDWIPGKPANQLRFIIGGVTPPFLFRDATGSPVGFDIDLAQALCTMLGVECKFVPRAYATIFQSLRAGEGDAVIGALAITDERRRMAAFTDPYADDYMRFISRKGFDRPLSREGLQGVRIGVPAGSENERYAQEHFGGSAEIVRLTGEFDVVPQAMIEGTVDLGFNCFITLYQFVNSPLGRDFQLVDEPLVKQVSAGIAVRHEDDELLSQLNAALHRVKAENLLEEIRIKWIPFSI